MNKQSGLGDALYIGGADLSGDITALGNIGGGPAVLTTTGINVSAIERIGGTRDGRLEYTAWWNPDPGGEHAVLSALPTTDVVMTYCRGTLLGSPAACINAKQPNYDGSRSDDGGFSFAVATQANGYGLEWGNLLTAGMRTDTAATLGAPYDTGAETAFGAQAYLQVSAFTGTDATVTIQDSADGTTFADVAGFAFTAVTAGPGAQRIATDNTATIRRHLRAVTVTTGGFTSLTFAVVVNKNPIAGVTF